MKTKIIKTFIEKWRVIFWMTLALLLLFAVTPRGYALSPETAQSFPYSQKFIITSYYSPLPDQSRYVTGSFEGDVRLNGEGVHAADGTIVYPGMAAAPPSFPFGTKMLIPGFGTVAIHDRGGAIKNNRLDIWVGSGEEGLRRALGWGMRTVDVTVFGIDPSIQEAVNFTDIPLANLAIIPQRTKYFKADIALGDTGEEVRELQRFLKKLGLLSLDATGVFDTETAAAVMKFQLESGVIENEKDSGAGNFGPRSRFALESLLDQKQESTKQKLPPPPLKLGHHGEGVRALQAALLEFGYLFAKDHPLGEFDALTREALFRFQVDASVLSTWKDLGAGFYGPQTKSALERLIDASFTPETTLIAPAKNLQSSSSEVFTKPLALGDSGNAVASLQEELARLNFFALPATGYYGNTTEHAVFKFQQAFGIVRSKSEEGAGVLGPKSQTKLNEFTALRTDRRRVAHETTEMRRVVLERVDRERVLLAGNLPDTALPASLQFGSRGREVEDLQKVLKRLGFFPGRLTTQYFGDITKYSLTSFQKSHQLQESGVFDESTKRILDQIISVPLSS